MKKRKSIDGSNPRITEDEASYDDKQTVALINLIVEILVEATFRQLEQHMPDDKNIEPAPPPIDGK